MSFVPVYAWERGRESLLAMSDDYSRETSRDLFKFLRWRENHVASRMKMLYRTSGRDMMHEIDTGLLFGVGLSVR